MSPEEFVSGPVELRPCPFCGRTDALDPNDNFGGERPYAVCCDSCEFVGPEAVTKAEAVEKWNTRPLEKP